MPSLFDFDKTLIYTDSFLPVMWCLNQSKYDRFVNISIDSVLMLLLKSRLISNDFFKKNVVERYLKNRKLSDLREATNRYKNKCKFTPIMLLLNINDIIVTASLRIVVEELTGNDFCVIGSELIVEDSKIIGLKRNNYGDIKLTSLKEHKDFDFIKVYSDSLTDLSLLEQAKEFHHVRKGRVIKIISNVSNI